MKKILIATTALVGSAGYAAAGDVSLSGDARMGVVYDNNGDLVFNSRARAEVSLSGESDGGLAFGGSFQIKDAGGAGDGLSGEAFISGSWGKLSMGDVDGAAKAAVGNIDAITLTGLGDTHELLYVNGGTDADGDGADDTIYPNPAALYEFSTGDFTFYAGAGSPEGATTILSTATVLVSTTGGGTVGIVAGATAALQAQNTYSVGAKWASNGYSIAAGFETLDANTITALGSTGFQTISQYVIGGSAEFGDFTVKANYGHIELPNSTTDQYGISGKYSMDALAVAAFYAHKDLAGGQDAYGIGAEYDLGGGLSVKGGIVNNYLDNTVADFGVSMDF